MPFYDIKTIWEYSKLTEHARQTKPYRNSSKDKPKYPLGNRRYSDRFYSPILDSLSEDDKEKWWYRAVPVEIYYQDRYKLGTVHSDSTFEFNPSAGSYSQGDTGVVSSILPGYIGSKSLYGGLVFHHRQSKVEVPVYENLRIRLCDGMPTEPYEMHVYSLDRKKTKPFRQKHDEMFKNGLFMLKAMGAESVVDELKSIALGSIKLERDYKDTELDMAYDPKDPAGAIIALALRYNLNDCTYKFSYHNSWGYQRFLASMSPQPLVRSVKNYFYRELYIRARDKGEELLQTKVYKYGDKLPTTEWGHKIFVNGVERKRLV